MQVKNRKKTTEGLLLKTMAGGKQSMAEREGCIKIKRLSQIPETAASSYVSGGKNRFTLIELLVHTYRTPCEDYLLNIRSV